jgi:tRNA A37 threonylcarbamoyladenosine modification protein TsaB
MACTLPIVPVSSLHLLALTAQQHWPHAKRILVVNNAFMGEVYAAHFVVRHGDICALGEEQIMQPERLTAEMGSSCVAVGDAWAAYPKQLAKLAHQIPVVDDRLRPAASSAFAFADGQIDAGNTCSHGTIKLAYLRHSGAWRKA